MIAGATTTTAIGGAIGAGAMPGHADEQAAVMAPVGWPPLLGVGHQGEQILLEALVVELLKSLAIVERIAEGIGGRIVLMQDRQVHLLRPPVAG